VLIDLSDNSNFRHVETGKIRLYTLDITVEQQTMTAGEWEIKVGVIVENDATDGTADWIIVIHAETEQNATDDSDRRHYHFDWPWGLDLQVDSSNDRLSRHVTNTQDAASVGWDNDDSLDSPVGDTTSAPGDGDLVLQLNEVTDGASISVCVTAQYATEGV
jgi:hypothetical protein